MRRLCWLLTAGLFTMPLAAAAAPDQAPNQAPIEQYSWSFSSGKGRLGVMLISLTPDLRHYFGTADDRGLLVAHVDPGSPAASAGIKAGDVITAVKAHPVERVADVISAIQPAKQGEDVAIDLVRDHKALTVHAVMADEAQGNLQGLRRSGSMRMPDMDRMPPQMEEMLRDLMREMRAWRFPHGQDPGADRDDMI